MPPEYPPSATPDQKRAVVESIWRRTLEGVPTLIGRLAYMSSLRTGTAGRYQHYGIAQRLGEDGTNALLSQSHIGLFREWLSLELRAQKRDVAQYLDGEDADAATVLVSWIALEPWYAWIPESSRDIERELYRGDMAIVLDLLRSEAGVGRRDPDS